MKKFLKISGCALLFVLAVLYCVFLFVLPKKIDLSQYKEVLQDIVKEQADLDLEYSNAQLVTTPLLRAGVKIDDIKITLPDNSLLLSSDGIKATVSLPSVLLWTIKVSEVEIEKPFINVEILENGEDYKIVKHIENILNTKKSTTFGEKAVVSENQSQFDFSTLKIIIPNVKLNNYKLLITDLSSNHFLDLHGEQLSFGYFDGKRIKVKTNAELFSDLNKNITANIDINTFLPEPSPKLDSEDDPAEKVDFSFINPVTTYQNYDLKTDIDTKIKINRNKEGLITSFGYLNIDNLTLKLSDIQLPNSYLKLKTFGSMADVDTNISPAKDSNINISGKFGCGRHKFADLSIKIDEIKNSNLLALSEAFLNSLQIPNELDKYSAEGSIIADCNIKTDFKKLNSEGYFKIQNGGLSVRELGKIISGTNINLIFDDNSLDINNSSLFINNSELKINGKIDPKSYIDINTEMEKLPLAPLFDAFMPKEIRNSYDFKSGDISAVVNINGKMKEAVTKVDAKLNNLDFADKQNSFNLKNNQFSSNFIYSAKNADLSGIIENKGFKFILPSTNSIVSFDKAKINIFDKNIQIEQNVINFNDKSALVYSGNIENYEKPKDINFIVNGGINTEDIIKLIGKEFKPFINSKGIIPVRVNFSGNENKQTLFAQVLADASNYITPVDFVRLKDLKTTLQATVDFKPSRIKIKNTGFYTRTYIEDENGEKTEILNKIIGIDGTVEKNNINLLKIDIDKDLEGKLSVFPQSKYVLHKAKLYLYGNLNSPVYKGDLRISNISVPEILASIDNVDLNLKETDLNFDVQNLKMLESDLGVKGKYSLVSDVVSNISDLDITSNFVNVDDIVKVSDKIISYLPKTSSSSVQADIPVSVHRGSVDMKRIITGNIEVSNIKSKLTLLKNNLNLKDLTANIFRGNINGDIFVNLLSMMISTDIQGRNINVEKALFDSANMKDSLSGSMNFKAKLNINAAAATIEEQMKGIDGSVDFSIKDGQFGPFGKLENLILAENIRESQFFQTALGGIIESIATIDTTHFSELNGSVFLKDGICEIPVITSQGNVMNIYLAGKFDLIKNYIDTKVRIKITSMLSNLLGPLNAINPINLVNSAASMNVVTAKAFSLFCEVVPEEEIAILPSFSNSYVDNSSTKFQLGVRGDVAKPFTLIKSFKWLTTQMQFSMAKEFTDSLPEPVEGSTATNIEEAIKEAQALEAEKKTLKYKIRHVFDKKEKTTKNTAAQEESAD